MYFVLCIMYCRLIIQAHKCSFDIFISLHYLLKMYSGSEHGTIKKGDYRACHFIQMYCILRLKMTDK